MWKNTLAKNFLRRVVYNMIIVRNNYNLLKLDLILFDNDRNHNFPNTKNEKEITKYIDIITSPFPSPDSD